MKNIFGIVDRVLKYIYIYISEKFTQAVESIVSSSETSARVYIHADEWGMLYTFLQPAFLYRIIARLALHPCRVTHMPYRPVKKLRRAIDDPEQPTLSPQQYLVSSYEILCNTLFLSSFFLFASFNNRYPSFFST